MLVPQCRGELEFFSPQVSRRKVLINWSAAARAASMVGASRTVQTCVITSEADSSGNFARMLASRWNQHRSGWRRGGRR